LRLRLRLRLKLSPEGSGEVEVEVKVKGEVEETSGEVENMICQFNILRLRAPDNSTILQFHHKKNTT
jgi:hypothetical protein